MARSGENERAILAFETALRFQPKMINAHRYLSDALSPNQAAIRRRPGITKARPPISPGAGRRRADSTAIEAKNFSISRNPKPRRAPEDSSPRTSRSQAAGEKSGKTFILVSGLPRSGTSLMMQMLEAGGLTILTDHERAADPDNPKGYYEWEPIKQIGKKPELLDEDGLDGRGISAFPMLLSQLPLKHNYKVIFYDSTDGRNCRFTAADD